MKLKVDIEGLKNNPDLKKVVQKVKQARTQLDAMLKDKTWVDDARKYAEKQSKEVKKLIEADAVKVRAFIEKERKELEKFQKQIPGEVEKIKKLVGDQRKELEKLLRKMGKMRAVGKRSKPAAGKKSGGSKSASASA